MSGISRGRSNSNIHGLPPYSTPPPMRLLTLAKQLSQPGADPLLNSHIVISAKPLQPKFLRACALASAVWAVAGATVACAAGGDAGAGNSTAAMGNAQPAASPAGTSPEGTVMPFAPVLNLVATGEFIAIQTADTLTIGTPAEVLRNGGVATPIDARCGDVTPAQDAFILPCQDRVLTFPVADPRAVQTLRVAEQFPVTAAAQLSTGEIFVASDQQAAISIYRDGQKIDSFGVAAPTSQLMAVHNPPAKGSAIDPGKDNVVRTWRPDTTIQSLDWKKSRQGGRLRVGKGVGKISSGLDGVIVAADTLGKRVAIYTASDVVRLHQFGNVSGIPWATAWDPAQHLAWVTTTDNNQAHAFDISAGVPKETRTVATVADAQSIATTTDGTVVVGSASGGGIQVISTQ